MRNQACWVRLTGIFFVLVFIIVTPLSLWVFNLGRVAFDLQERVDLAVKILVKTDLIPVALAVQTSDDPVNSFQKDEKAEGEPDIGALFHFLGKEEWKEIQSEMLPMYIYQTWVVETSDSIEDWFNNSEPYPEVLLGTEEFQERWTSVHGQNVMDVFYHALPPCTAQDFEDFIQRDQSESIGPSMAFNLCQLPSPWNQVQYEIYQQSISLVVSSLPDEIQVFSPDVIEQNFNETEMYRFKNRLLIMRGVSLNVLFLPGFVLLLITIIAVRSIYTWSTWWGIPLFFSGILTLPVPIIQQWLVPWSANLVFKDIPASLRSELNQAVIQANNEIFTPLYWQAGLLLLAGILLLLIAIISRPKRSVQRDEF